MICFRLKRNLILVVDKIRRNPYNIANMKEKALIPNGQIEEMFLRIATDDMMKVYSEHIEAKRINLATAYASNAVKKKFFKMIANEERVADNFTYWNKKEDNETA